MYFEEYNEDYGRNEFGNQFEKEVTQMSALQSFLLGNELKEVKFTWSKNDFLISFVVCHRS